MLSLDGKICTLVGGEPESAEGEIEPPASTADRTEPDWLTPIVGNLPQDLVSLPQWMTWNPVSDPKSDGTPYWSKPPCVAETGKQGSKTNPTDWCGLFGAVQGMRRHGMTGVGLCLTAENRLAVADLDGCRDPKTGTIAAWAREFVGQLASYTEVSPSGRGLRTVARGSIPEGAGCHWRFGGHKVEVYTSRAFVTMTGHHLEGTPHTIQERTAELASLWEECRPPEPPPRPLHRSAATAGDRELIERAMTAKNGDSFARLWRGDVSEFAGNGESGRHLADWHLCLRLAYWTGGDAERMDRLFRQSGLYRDKWDRREGPYGTYGWRTIQKVLGR